ncbi:histone deacetylase complex subunit SAP30 homolog isoform X3 [Homarus americanus]|nr:histone deacetylase complex subunit SAP30 homolog isoform X3 [Homarus americanus]
MNGLSTEEDSGSQHDQVCCLVDAGERCTQSAGNAAYNKRIQKTVAQRKLRLHMDSTSSHNYICEHHKSVIQSVRVKRKRRESEEDSGEFDGDHPEVELYNLQAGLRLKYCRVVEYGGQADTALASCFGGRRFDSQVLPVRPAVNGYLSLQLGEVKAVECSPSHAATLCTKGLVYSVLYP